MTTGGADGWRRAPSRGGVGEPAGGGRGLAVRALVAAVAVLVTGGVVVAWLLGSSGPPRRGQPVRARPVAAGAAGVEPARMVGLAVASVTGPVQRRREGAVNWEAVRPGETIGMREALRTGTGGAAVLELNDHTTIWMWPESEVTADRLDVALARVGVEGGRLDLSVPDGPRTVEVAARGGATASTQGAQFSVIVDGGHVATVATREGLVDVVSGTGRVRVPPGMQARAAPGTPTVVSPVPRELLLSVDWPGRVIRSRTAVIRGRAPAGVLVSVGGARVVVGDDGRFEHEVPLAEGPNEVEVAAEDVVGHQAVRRGAVRVDTHAPRVRARGRFE